jgi:hypothetical protein
VVVSLPQPVPVEMQEIRDGYVRLGWRRKERLFVAKYSDGSKCVGYRLTFSRVGPAVFVAVHRLD